jgi:large repetitive protein
MSLGVAVGRGLTSDLGSPELRGVVTFAFAPSAPALPPLRTPSAPGPVDPTQEDTDFDRISDADDKCPTEPEDKDRFEDEDGCPDPDNDNDGAPDASDKCPEALEDKDGFADEDGCPELDNDKDGVADKSDKCPDKPEKINGKDDGDGCPDTGDSLVINTPDRLELMESVLFKGEGVAKDSANVLNQLAATMRSRVDIKRLRITVHVNPGKNPKKDQALSDKRATAVKSWLVHAGLEADRIDVRGFGSTKPLVPSTQKGAPEINDRVELIILERE